MGTRKKRILAFILTAAVALSMQPAIYAENTEEAVEESEVSTITNIMNTGNRDSTYSAYYEKHGSDKKPNAQIVIEAKKAVCGADADGVEPVYEITDYEGEKDCFVWTNNRGEVSFDF